MFYNYSIYKQIYNFFRLEADWEQGQIFPEFKEYMKVLPQDILLSTIKSLKNNKLPGRNSFPGKFYKRFSNIIAEPPTRVCDDFFSLRLYSGNWWILELWLFLNLVKTLQIHTLIELNSLLNQDAKIFMDFLTTRLNTFITHYIHYIQIGLMPNCQNHWYHL